MVDYQETAVSLRGGRLQLTVLEGGSGAPLVYLHGANGLPGWAPYLDRLAQQFRVYAPYHPGVGPSVGLEHLDDLWDLVLVYEELLDAIGVEHTLLVGHCYGGMVAAELAAQCPHRIDRLVLVDALGLWLDDTPVTDFFVLMPEELAKATWYEADSDVAKAVLAEPEDRNARIEASLDRTKTLAAIGKFSWPIPERGLRKRIHRIASPTLLVWGREDGIVPLAYGEEFHRLIPKSCLVVLDRCGHNPQQECPQEFFGTLETFLKGK